MCRVCSISLQFDYLAAAGSRQGRMLYGEYIFNFWGPKISSFFMGKFFQKMKMDKNKCPKTDLPKYFPQKHAL
jgi:hypothetical protein